MAQSGDTPMTPTINVPSSFNLSKRAAASVVPPGMGELNYIQTLLAGLIDQALYTTSSPTFLDLTLSALTASALVGSDANKLLQSVNPGTSLSLSGTSLNTIQGIRTVDSPTFAGLTVGALSGILKAASGVMGAATIGNSLSYSAPTLDAIQDIRTSATPSFTGIILSKATHPVMSAIRMSSATNTQLVGGAFEHRTTGNMVDGFGSGVTIDIRDSAGVSNTIAGLMGVRAGNDTTGTCGL